MKKFIPLIVIALVAAVVVIRQRSAKTEADLWREATKPAGQ